MYIQNPLRGIEYGYVFSFIKGGGEILLTFFKATYEEAKNYLAWRTEMVTALELSGIKKNLGT